ncbi:MAG TPA: hypothetical protein VLQ93_19760 [Myxococcaceae bacterium]|nr:hypothetical protein [Myxococcaceae bacterium]
MRDFESGGLVLVEGGEPKYIAEVGRTGRAYVSGFHESWVDWDLDGDGTFDCREHWMFPSEVAWVSRRERWRWNTQPEESACFPRGRPAASSLSPSPLP